MYKITINQNLTRFQSNRVKSGKLTFELLKSYQKMLLPGKTTEGV